ncbi:general transcription factor II-I repeat domain-containing protein 2-like [Hypanus sabinus]|uniref:general transcription factor II-I repeat domain-containing protein 2-like n=1 Tax=Hypanus sabinus TaxID=79690 RepID=UPI0028C447BF|nr:general transcription factor II-I repeat domain-containing protein 2-like [Hypanus sabinus]
MAERKVDFENRGFQGRWEAEYMFADIKGKPACLVCGDGVAVIKEYNVRRHYETKHHDKYKHLDKKQKSAMCGQKSGLVGRIRQKMREENGAGELTAYHCIIHQESLCGKALKMEHIMSTITRAVNFIRAKGLNHREFKSFLEELGSEYNDLPYHTEVRWLSQRKELKRCFELREEICQFMESKGKDTTGLRDKKLLCEMAFLCDITSHLNALNLQL